MGLAKRGSLCMMEDRGFLLTCDEKRLMLLPALDISYDALNRAREKNISLGQALSCTYDALGSLKRTFVVFVDRNFNEKKGRELMVSSAQVKYCVNEKDNDNNEDTHTVLILPNKLSPDARKSVSANRNTIQAMLGEALFLPLGRHIHVPRHVRLLEKEANEFEKTRGILRHQLPILSISDPVSQYYGFAEGDIIRIERAMGNFYRTISIKEG